MFRKASYSRNLGETAQPRTATAPHRNRTATASGLPSLLRYSLHFVPLRYSSSGRQPASSESPFTAFTTTSHE